MKKYYYITSKPDDYNAMVQAVIYTKESNLKKSVYCYEEISVTDFKVLERYIGIIEEDWYKDFGYKNLKEYLEAYFG